jgi:membrane protein YqaA with SNARE-associated domain
MDKFLLNFRERLKKWIVIHAVGPFAKVWLAAVSFAEATFFPIPPDPFLVAILLGGGRKKWAYYSFITVIFSVLGGAFGYLIGLFFFDTIGQWLINVYNLQEGMIRVSGFYDRNAFWAIFISAFTPIPFKIFTITAGFFQINFLVFIISSFLGRALRFFLVGWLFNMFGESIAAALYKYFNAITLVIGIVIVAIILLGFF